MTTVCIDGVLVSPEAATISVFDRGVLYGDGLFEILRTWHGVAVDLDAHLDRLYASAHALSLRARPRAALASDVLAAVAAAGTGSDHRIRIVVTRGPGALTARLAELGPGRAIVVVEPLPPLPRTLALATVDWPLPRRPAPAHKLLAYADHVLARELAAAAGADEAVRLDADGDVAEGATSNLFLVAGGALVTPPLAGGSGILPGVTRARVLACAERLAIPARVEHVSLAALQAADELFVTSAVRGVVAVVRLDGEDRMAGPITARLAAAYEHDFRL